MDTDLIFRIILGLLFLVTLVTQRYYERKAAATAQEGLLQDKDHRHAECAAGDQPVGTDRLRDQPGLEELVHHRLTGLAALVRGCAGNPRRNPAGLGAQNLGGEFLRGHEDPGGAPIDPGGTLPPVRHPMYTAFILLGIGLFFLSGNWLIDGAWLAATGLVIATRMPEEEAMLAEQFGKGYEDYKIRTGRFLPKL